MGDVQPELKAMFVASPRNGISILASPRVRESGALQESRYANVQRIEEIDVRWKSKGICIAGGADEIRQFVLGGWLGEFEFKIPAILEAHFVGEGRSEEGVELCHAPGIADIVVAETGDSESVCRLRLDARRGNPSLAVYFSGKPILRINLPIEFGEEDGLLAFAGYGTQLSQQCGQTIGVVGLGLSRLRGGRRICIKETLREGIYSRSGWSCEEWARVARNGSAWEVSCVTVKRKEEEEFVFEGGATDPAAPNLADVHGLIGKSRENARRSLGEDFCEGVGGAPVVVAIVEVGLTVVLICAALSDRVDDGAGGAAVLGGIVRGIDLKFLDGSLGSGVADARTAAFLAEKRLVVVGAINGVVI